jgi:diguanylate cyclase (GGDEF)-like protein
MASVASLIERRRGRFASTPLTPLDRDIANDLAHYTAEHSARSVGAGPVAAVMVFALLHSTPWAPVEIAWTVIAALTSPLTTWWCWRQRHVEVVSRPILRALVGGHSVWVLLMPLFFVAPVNSARASMEVGLAASMAVTFLVMTSGDRFTGFVVLFSVIIGSIFGFDAFDALGLALRGAIAVLAMAALGPLVGSLHAPLYRSVRLRLENIALVDELRQSNEALARELTTDALTKLTNRAGFDAAIERSSSVGVIYVDVDRFKEINDTFGHAIGDEVLQRVAAALNRDTRRGDVVARLGGDEFVLLINDTNDELLASVAQRLHDSVHREFADGSVTVSIGAANATSNDMTPLDVLHLADAQLYAAKRSGRDRVSIMTAHRNSGNVTLITEASRQPGNY